MKITKFKIILLVISILLIFQIYKNLTIPNTIGVESGKFKALKDSPNGVSSQSNNPDDKVAPLEMHGTVSEEKEKIKDLILSYENTKLIEENNDYLHFVFTTNFFHFKDDIEFFFDTENNIIDFKSQSRIGYSDMGVNRERYKRIREDYLNLN